jgi:thioesterase domain-containing protein
VSRARIRAEISAKLAAAPELREHAGTALPAILNALDLTRPGPIGRFSGDVLYFAAASGPPRPVPVAELWRPYVDGEIEAHAVPADHDSMLEPVAVRAIGEVLGPRLGGRADLAATSGR